MPATLDARLQRDIDAAGRWAPMPPPIPAERMPRHVAIIMDGNGRWATRQGLLRVNGHRAGVDAVRDATEYCGQTGIAHLTLYAFSTENWKRPQAEIEFLFKLLKTYLVRERAELLANNVRLSTIGRPEKLPGDVRAELDLSVELSAGMRGLNLCLALNYGAQDELLQAGARAAERGGGLDEHLFTAGMPPVDLLLRTASEQRLSNFLLWQTAGAEYVPLPVCWPEFRREHFSAALQQYAERR